MNNAIDPDAFLGEAWYALQVVPGSEDIAKENIMARAESMGLQDKILDVLIPCRKVTKKKKDGTPKTVDENFQEGYIYVFMKYTKESWFVVRNTPKVLGILGSSGGGKAPVPVPQDEIDEIRLAMDQDVVKPQEELHFEGEIGSTVKIISGNFFGNVGTVSAIDNPHQTVHVLISLFGRETDAEVRFAEVEITGAAPDKKA